MKTELKVEGMNCTNCALGIKKQLDKLDLQKVYVNFTTSEVKFEANNQAEVDIAIDKIKSLGYYVTGKSIEKDYKKGWFTLELKFIAALVFTIPLLLGMFLPYHLFHQPIFQLILVLPVLAIGIIQFGRSAVNSLLSGVPNMDVLVMLGVIAAFVYSFIGTVLNLGHNYQFYETSATIITLILLGNLIEHRSVKKTTSAIDELVKMQKVKAKRIINFNLADEYIEEVDSEEINVNNLLLVQSGENIPTDSIIIDGFATIDESMLSGESIPVDKKIGDKVVGGTVVLSGRIIIKATATGDETVLAQIIELVKNAQQDKPQLQNLADKISAVFVPVVVAIALLTFAVSFWVADVELKESFLRSIAVLVIACPCALGLAIPTAVVVGVGRVAKNGILIKGASTIQKFDAIKYIIFDKTGTLTDGKFKIKQITNYEKPLDEIKSILLSIEKHSPHPIAKSIVTELADSELIDLYDIVEDKGIGISASDKNGNKYSVGSYKIAKHLTKELNHAIYLLENDKLIATLDIEDNIKEHAAETINYFKNRGIQPIILSGDRKEKCENVALKLGIDIVYSEKLPSEKLLIIDEIACKGKVAMVGDGVNDAPALAKAFVGISLSNANQIAIKSAQVILLNGNLSLLTKAFGISRNTVQIIKQNLFWAFFYNVLAIPIAASGFLNPMIAAFSMALSDVIVVLNSLRLRSKRIG